MKVGKRSWKKHREETARQRRVAAETTTLLKMKIRNCGRLHGRGREVILACLFTRLHWGWRDGSAVKSTDTLPEDLGSVPSTHNHLQSGSPVSEDPVSYSGLHRHQVCMRCTVISADTVLTHIHVLKMVSNGFKVLRETAIWSIHNQKLFYLADSSQHEADLSYSMYLRQWYIMGQ